MSQSLFMGAAFRFSSDGFLPASAIRHRRMDVVVLVFAISVGEIAMCLTHWRKT